MTRPLDRRGFLKAGGVAALSLAGCASLGRARPRVVVIGAGFGGATAARYLRRWAPEIEVVLVEREAAFVSCPVSNLVLAGYRTMADITLGYAGLERAGVRLVRDEATAVDVERRTVHLARGGALVYDRLIVAPGVDFIFEDMPHYRAAMQAGHVLHAWKAGPQTLALRRRLEEMPHGGVFVLSIPLAPYRCPAAPYERACVVASYFQRAKPRAKVLVLDANPDVTSKAPLFKRAWAELYPKLIEYRPSSIAVDVDPRARVVNCELEDVKGDVLNVLPPQRAGDIARRAGLITANDRWCETDWRTMESVVAPRVHVLGDSTLAAAVMPKSASMANQHAKLAASAIAALTEGRAPNPDPKIINTCYSYVSETEAIHVDTVYEWNAHAKTLGLVHGSGGISAERSALEGTYARAWAENIWHDCLG